MYIYTFPHKGRGVKKLRYACKHTYIQTQKTHESCIHAIYAHTHVINNAHTNIHLYVYTYAS